MESKINLTLFCGRCKKELKLKFFSKYNSKKRARKYQSWCKSCNKQYQKDLREKNIPKLKYPDYIFIGREKERNNEYYKSLTPEQIQLKREKGKLWARNNREKIREYQRLYHLEYRKLKKES